MFTPLISWNSKWNRFGINNNIWDINKNIKKKKSATKGETKKGKAYQIKKTYFSVYSLNNKEKRKEEKKHTYSMALVGKNNK